VFGKVQVTRVADCHFFLNQQDEKTRFSKLKTTRKEKSYNMEHWLANPKQGSRRGSNGPSRNTSVDYSAASLHGLSTKNSTGFVLSNDELDRLDVVVRQYENNKTTASSSAEKSRSNSIQSAGSFVDLTSLDHDSDQTMTNTYKKLQTMKTALLLKEIQSQKSKDSGTASISERSRSNSIHSADTSLLLQNEMQTKARSSSLGSKVNTTTTLNTKNHTRSHSVCLSSEDDEQHYHQSSPISIKPRSPSEHHPVRSRSRSGSMVAVAVDNSLLSRISELESIIRSDSDVSVHLLEKPKFSMRQLWSNVCTLLHSYM